MKTSSGNFLLASVAGPQGESAVETDEEKRKREAEKAKMKPMKAGGYVKAADGCAKKGKTKGRMV